MNNYRSSNNLNYSRDLSISIPKNEEIGSHLISMSQASFSTARSGRTTSAKSFSIQTPRTERGIDHSHAALLDA